MKKKEYLALWLTIVIVIGMDILIISGTILGMLLTRFFSISEETVRFLQYVVPMGAAFLFAYYLRKWITGRFEFRIFKESYATILLTIICSVVLLLGVLGPLGTLIPIPDYILNQFIESTSQKGFLIFIMMVLAAPILEELIFRGVILESLLKRYSPWVAIIISSFLFGIAHLNPWQFISGFVLGLLSGWLYYRTKGNILLSIIVHMAANLSGYILRHVFDFNQLAVENLYYGTGSFLELLPLVIFSIFIAAVCLFYLNRILKNDRFQG